MHRRIRTVSCAAPQQVFMPPTCVLTHSLRLMASVMLRAASNPSHGIFYDVRDIDAQRLTHGYWDSDSSPYAYDAFGGMEGEALEGPDVQQWIPSGDLDLTRQESWRRQDT